MLKIRIRNGWENTIFLFIIYLALFKIDFEGYQDTYTSSFALFKKTYFSRQLPEIVFLAPAVTVGETKGAMDSTSVFFCLFFCL